MEGGREGRKEMEGGMEVRGKEGWREGYDKIDNPSNTYF